MSTSETFITANVYGRELLLPSNHMLPTILANCPEFGEPLALTVDAIENSPVRVIDVGANVGDSVALIEQHSPGRCVFLCIEPDDQFSMLCRRNLAHNSRVEVLQYAIANAQTHQVLRRVARLDDIATSFLAAHGGVDLIKVDTDGYDFSVLRSAAGILQEYFPLVFFELHPTLWDAAGEDCAGVFFHLAGLNYKRFVFFSNRGILYAQIDSPSVVFLNTLFDISRSRRHIDDFHFDVLTGAPELCQRAAELSLMALRDKTRI